MHTIIKSGFYIIFIIISCIAGIHMLIKSNGDKKVTIFGLMVLLLGVGESFHLVPRIFEIFSNSSKDYGAMIETGRFIASLSIIFVYYILFWFCNVLCNTSPTKKRNITLIILGILSIAVSILFWNTDDTLFVLLRNVPTIVIGLLVVVYFNGQTSSILNHPFKYLGLALILSLLFTIGFELLGQDYPFFIILMMPKTLMYIWIILMGYIAYRKERLSENE